MEEKVGIEREFLRDRRGVEANETALSESNLLHDG